MTGLPHKRAIPFPSRSRTSAPCLKRLISLACARPGCRKNDNNLPPRREPRCRCGRLSGHHGRIVKNTGAGSPALPATPEPRYGPMSGQPAAASTPCDARQDGDERRHAIDRQHGQPAEPGRVGPPAGWELRQPATPVTVDLPSIRAHRKGGSEPPLLIGSRRYRDAGRGRRNPQRFACTRRRSANGAHWRRELDSNLRSPDGGRLLSAPSYPAGCQRNGIVRSRWYEEILTAEAAAGSGSERSSRTWHSRCHRAGSAPAS